MITTDLFPNASSFYVGQTANQYTCYLSGDLYNLTIPDVSVFDGYYLGWCTPETLPSGVLQTSYYVDTTNNKLKFFQSTPNENFKIGYGRKQPESGGYTARVRTIVSDGASPTTQFHNVQYNYLYNNLYPEYLSGVHLVVLTFVYYSPEFNGASESGGTFQKSFGIDYNYADFYSFIYDDMPLSITIRLNNINHTFSLKYSDLKDKFFESFIADTGREFIIYPTGLEWRGNEAYNGSYSSNDSIYESLVIYNSCVNEYNSNTTHTLDSKNVIITNAIGGMYGFWNGTNRTLSTSVNFITASIPTCDIDFSELDSGDYLIFKQNDYGNGGAAFIRNGVGALERNIYFVSPLKYLISAIMLMWRTQINRTYSYQLGGSWATDVNENDQFLGEWKTGNIANATFKNGLRPWQYSSIQDNEFEPDDTPPYTPPSPPDEDEESGDRIPNQFRYFSGATNFITQYALTRTQVGQFGTKLWTSWADSLGDPTDMWKNFKIFIGGGDTGSIDIGTVLSFIVSLRVFPFDLSAYLGQSEPSIKIGTGNYPIEVANVWKLLSTVTYIDCGTVSVPRKFNDFRDYTNVTVSCYFPYCGTVQLNAGDVVGKTLHAWYAVDLQSGECLAILESYDDTGMLYNVASISGSMGALIPITATNSGQIMAQRISDAANVAGFFVGNVTRGADIFSSGMLGKKKSARRQSAMIGGIAEAISGQIEDIGDMANQGMSMLSRGAIECPSMSGGSGLAAFMTPDSPYIQLRYGIYSEPNNYSHSVGRVSTSSNSIGNYKGSGYIVCENVDTSGLTCHNDEKAAIAAALETGVFV